MVFWFGDLNFRIDDLDMQVVKSAIDNNKFVALWEKDQVRINVDFLESKKCNFTQIVVVIDIDSFVLQN